MKRCASVLSIVGLAACAASRAVPQPTPTGAQPRAAAAEPSAPFEPAAGAAPVAPPASVAAAPEIEVRAAPEIPPEPAPQAAPESAASVAERDLRERIKRAVDAGDYATARAILDDMQTLPMLAEARALLDGGRTREALAVTERVLALAPSEPRVLAAHGEASLREGVEHGDRERVETALRAFVQAGDSAVALLGASRAARWLDRFDEALRLAREGSAAWLALSPQSRPPLPERAERTLAEALVAASRSTSAEGPETDALEGETESALSRLVEVDPLDRWGWTELAALLVRADRAQDAIAALERAIAALPRERELFDLLARTARELGGREAAVAALERVAQAAPWNGVARERAAAERLTAALERQSEPPLDELRAAAAGFAAARRLDPSLVASAVESEAACRAAAGWWLADRGELDAALVEFRAAGALGPGGLRAHVEGVVAAAEGIAKIARAFGERERTAEGAEIAQALRAREPERVEWAMLAGELYRDAGERTELTGRDCMLAAKGALADARRVETLRERVGIAASIQNQAELRRAFAKAGEHRLGRAREMYAASFDAYLDAVELAPDDLRALNDCALVAVYHIEAERDRAESLLKRCVAVGAGAVADPSLSAERRNELLGAWGDAHQNLGKLYLERFDRPDRAERWFKRALEIGPYPRPEVTEFYLPRCAELQRAKK